MTTLAKMHYFVAPGSKEYHAPRIQVSMYGHVHHHGCRTAPPRLVQIVDFATDEAYERAATLAEQHDIPLIVYEEDIPF